MSAGIEHNAHQVAARFTGAAGHVRREVAAEMRDLSGRIAAVMRVRAPKFRSTLTNSINVEKVTDLEWLIKPSMAYAINVERGRKPGKGLPRVFTPESAAALNWLAAQSPTLRVLARRGRRKVELDLRDRYMAWSRAVKAHGIKPHPFVKPTADQFRPLAGPALMAAVRRGLAAAGIGGGST